MIPCGATLTSICPPCAERAKALRAAQCREGWHLEDEPDLFPAAPDEIQEYWLTVRAEAQALPDRAALRGEDTAALDELITELDSEITRAGIRGTVTTHHNRDGKQQSRRSRSTRRRQDAAPLPVRKIAPRTTGRVYTTPDGKRYRPSMFLTLTCDSYGKVNDDGTPADPASYDYTRAARDAIHFAALVDRFIQNLRRVLGYEAQYFGGVEPQKRLAPHVHLAVRGSVPRSLLRQVLAATYHQVWVARVKDLWTVYPDRRGRGKRWLSIWIDPTGRERSQAFSKKSDAERYASTMETEIAQGAYIDPKKARITVAEWCSTWLEGYATRRSSTVRQANVHIRRIVAEFGPYPIGSLRPSQIRSWVAGLREEGLEDSYIYALHSRLAQILSDAVHDGLLVKSPCSRRTSSHLAEQRVHVATTGQVWELYDLFPARTRLAILLGAFVGLRLGEACGLRPEDIDFMRGVVHPRVQYPTQPLKTRISQTPVPTPHRWRLSCPPRSPRMAVT
jgi:integrase